MTENEDNVPRCLECGTPLVDSYLTGPVDPIHVESMKSVTGSPLQALVCPKCGYIELRAEQPEELGHKDITEDELPG